MTPGSEEDRATGSGMVPSSRVVLVDGRGERLAVMRAIVEQSLGDGTVVGAAGTATEAVAAVDRYAANVAVVEIQLPQVADGVSAVGLLRLGHPSLRIVICSFSGDAATQRRSQEAGADLFLVKPVSSRELRRALGAVRAEPSVIV